jgi:RND family efflux transporter MFP subunit
MANVISLRSGQLLSLALTVALVASSCRGGPSAVAEGPPPIPVELATVESGTVRESSDFVGALEAKERVTLRPEVQGRVVAVYVEPGERVERGTPMVQLEPDQSEAEVRGANADITAAQAARSTAQARLRAAEADLASARSNVELQNTEYERARTLVAEGAQAQQVLDQAANSRNAAIAELNAAQQDVQAARAEVNESSASIARAQADASAIQEDLRFKRVAAPIAGVVGDVPVKVGDYVQPGDSLTTIVQNQTLELNISIPIERAPELRIGVPVELLDSNGEALITGRVSFISPEVNNAAQAVLAKASFISNGALRDGQFVRARVIWETGDGVLVPTSAITRIAGQTFVFVAQPNENAAEGQPKQVASQRLVQLGEIQGNNYQVLSGLEPGEQLITAGILNLTDGAPIMTGQPGGQPEASPAP